MIRRHVERFKIMVVVLNFGTIHNVVSGSNKDLFDSRKRLSHRMQAAAITFPAG
jgi:hypothetical protein